jgi:hypothetical protein
MTKRVFCFNLSADEISSPTKKVAFCKKLPATANNIKNTGEREDLDNNRSDLLYIIDTLWRNPSLCGPNAKWLQRRLECQEQPSELNVFQKVSSVRHLDIETKVDIIMKSSRLPLASLEAVTAKDDESLNQLLVFGGIKLNLRLPDECKDKKLCKSVLKSVLDANAPSARLGSLVVETLVDQTNGCINWPSLGVYVFSKFDKERAIEITHKPTQDKVALPDHAPVTKSFKLKGNWDDMLCTVNFQKVSHTVADFFKDNEGPNKVKFIDGNNAAFQSTCKTEKMKIDAARVALNAKQEDRNNKRESTLGEIR